MVDGRELICEGLRAILCRQAWVARCMGATELDTASELAFMYEPHVALVDLVVGGDSGVDIGRTIRENCSATRILFMSDSDRSSESAARASGGYGFISKGWNASSIVAAVRCATLGRPVLMSVTSTRTPAGLSSRERDVLRQLILGATNAEAGACLNLSPHTIKQHTRAVYRKLGVRNRTEAVSRAHSLGLLD